MLFPYINTTQNDKGVANGVRLFMIDVPQLTTISIYQTYSGCEGRSQRAKTIYDGRITNECHSHICIAFRIGGEAKNFLSPQIPFFAQYLPK